MRRVLVAVLLSGVAVGAAGQPREAFRAAVSGRNLWCFVATPYETSPYLQWLRSDGESFDVEAGFFHIDSADGWNVFATVGGEIIRVAPNGWRVPFFSHPTLRAGPVALAPSGRIFVVLHQSPGLTFLGVISPDGVLIATHPLPYNSAWAIWDAGNDCNVFYRRANYTIARFDACAGVALPDLPMPWFADLEVLPNGEFLVATSNRVNLYDSMGTFVRTIVELPGGSFIEQVAISPHGDRVAYALGDCTQPSQVVMVAFADGSELSREYIEINMPNGLVLGAAEPAPIPTTNEIALLILTLTLASAAVSLLRR